MRLENAYLDESVFACLEITTIMPILDLDIDVARASVRVNRHGGDSNQWAGDSTGMKIVLCDQKHVSKIISEQHFRLSAGASDAYKKGTGGAVAELPRWRPGNCEATGAPEVLFDRCQFT